MKKLLTVLYLLVPVAVLAAVGAPAAPVAAPITPDVVRSFFDANAMLIMFVWGILHTRLPQLAKFPNQAVPWVNVGLYMLTKLIVPDAHAGVLGGVASAGGWAWTVAKGAWLSALTSLLYDKFVKAPLDIVLPVAVRK